MAKQQSKKMWYAHLTVSGSARLEEIPVRGTSRFVIDADAADRELVSRHFNRKYAKNGNLSTGTVFETAHEALDKLSAEVDKAIIRAEQVLARLEESKVRIAIVRQKLKNRKLEESKACIAIVRQKLKNRKEESHDN